MPVLKSVVEMSVPAFEAFELPVNVLGQGADFFVASPRRLPVCGSDESTFVNTTLEPAGIVTTSDVSDLVDLK